MIAIALVGSNNLEKAKGFYDELMGVIGAGKVFDHGSGGRIYGKPGQPMFGVVGPYNKEPATIGNGSMLTFGMENDEQVSAFHAKALALGGSCEGPPGDRGAGPFRAYMRDLDGNKICAMKVG